MSKTIEIDVTQADIDAGERRNCSRCPLALAASRAFPKEILRVYGYSISVFGKALTKGGSIQLPTSAQKFIHSFDKKWPVAPFRFTVTVPDDMTPSPSAAPP